MTVDLVLPSLDEEAGLGWLLPRLPDGVRAVVVDNGSRDHTVEVAERHGATVVTATQRGFGSACWAGLTAATADVVAFMDADASLDPQQLHRVLDPVLAGDADLVLGARVPERGAWPLHARVGNAVLARQVRRRTGLPMSDLGPMRAARRTDLLALDLQDRRSGWPLEMLLKAAGAGWRVREVRVGYRPREGRSKVTGTARGTLEAVLDMRAQLGEDPVRVLVLAKSPVAGRSKTRLQQRWSPEQAAALAEAALADTLEAVRGVEAVHEIVLDGSPGPWLPQGFRVRAQVSGTHAERIAAAFAPHSSPCLLIGMDTPQVTTELLTLGLQALHGSDASFGLAEDGGWWALGLRQPSRHGGLVLGVATSTATTGSDQLSALVAAGLSVAALPVLRDVDLPDDALHVAGLVPTRRFAGVLRGCEAAA